MEDQKNPKPEKRIVSDVIDSIGDSSQCTNDHGIVSSPKKLLKMAQVDVTDASPPSQDSDMSPR
jgi:hypothetical protein